MLCWDDLRFFLAVARGGTTVAAAGELGVSQTTAARRVSALEQALGLTMFERRQQGFMLTPAGEALIARAEAVEQAVRAFADSAAAAQRETTGAVRLTTPEIYAVTFLPAMLRDLHDAHPEVRIALDTTDIARDLDASEADIALRTWHGSPPAALVGRRIAADPWTLYCSADYAARHRRPSTAEDLREHPIIGGGGGKVWPAYRAWLSRHGLEDSVAVEQGSAAGLLAAVRAGAGLAVLPSFHADRAPDLVRCLPPVAGEEVGLWLLTSERVRRTPRIRLVLDFLADRLRRLAAEPIDHSPAAWAA